MNNQQLDTRLYYSPSKQITIIKQGNFHGYNWQIASNGAYPLMYITLPNNHVYNYLGADWIMNSYGWGIDNDISPYKRSITYFKGNTIGFDFAGTEDLRNGYWGTDGRGKSWTLEEIEQLIQQYITIRLEPEADNYSRIDDKNEYE